MTGETDRVWWVEKAESYTGSLSTTAAAWAGEINESNGLAGIRQLVLEEASEAITDAIGETADTKITAFNYETSGWPHVARGWLARYEQLYTDREDEEYSVSRYADQVEIPDEIEMQTTLDCYYDENVLNDLSGLEARVVLESRVADPEIDEQQLLEQVEDYREYLDVLRDIGNPTAALRMHEFDRSVPTEILGDVLPPEEWESDPTNIRHDDCIRCGITYYLVETGGGTKRVDRQGNEPDGAVDPMVDDGFFNLQEDRGGLYCGTCGDVEWNESNTLSVVVGGSIIGGVACGSILKIHENSSDPEMLTNPEVDHLQSMELRGRPENADYFRAAPETTVPFDMAARVLEWDDFPDAVGPVFFYQDSVWVPRDDPGTTEAVKQFLEGWSPGVPA